MRTAELAVIDGGGTIESWNPARGSSSLAFQSGPVAYPAISANGKFISARTAANEFVIEKVDDHRFESLGFKVNGRVASLSVGDAGDALLWSNGDLAHLDIDQAIKWSESVASNRDNPGAKSDTLGTLITLPLNLAKRTPQGWTTQELCHSKNDIPWGLKCVCRTFLFTAFLITYHLLLIIFLAGIALLRRAFCIAATDP
jgi:hypothetical protein